MDTLNKRLYGKYVQMNDRFGSIHVWSEELAVRNEGRFKPTEMKSFQELNMVHKDFVDRKFPNITDWRGPLHHLSEEVKEAIESGEEEEFAYLQLLILSAFRLRFPGASTNHLIKMCFRKLKKLEGIEWGEVNDKGFQEHIK